MAGSFSERYTIGICYGQCAPFSLWESTRNEDGRRFILKKLSKPESPEKAERLWKLITEESHEVDGKHAGLVSIAECHADPEQFYILYEYPKQSILTLSRFHVQTSLSSPSLAKGLGAKDSRLRFIAYQIMQTMHYLHQQEMFSDSLLPSNICVDENLWVRIFVNLLSARREQYKRVKCEQQKVRFPLFRPPGYKKPLTLRWIDNEISNFEYLMAINLAAGRSLDSMSYHPIMPWVTDFSSGQPTVMNGGLRDLSMTKFRLSKGDRQLETTYLHSDPPHHLPESLSELTYCIYMARRIPLYVLKKIVRSEFVPEHYPHSMSRMYSWSPDECVPAFFADTKVFQSIHKVDPILNDLEMPAFAPTPEEFIRFHRGVLESEYVSANLHLWIDLTFGCNLQGDLAIKNRNVPLKYTMTPKEVLGDSPCLDKNPGFVILFNRPHPRKRMPLSRDETAGQLKGTMNEPFEDITGQTCADLDARNLELTISLDHQSRVALTNDQTMLHHFMSRGSVMDTATSTGNSLFKHDQSSADNVLNCFRFAPKIDLNAAIKPGFHYFLDEYKNYDFNNSFASEYASCLQPKYAQSENISKRTEYTATSDMISEEFPQNTGGATESEMIYSSASQLDYDFFGALTELDSIAKEIDVGHLSEEEQIVTNLRCEDYFGLATIIAEMYICRPLLGELDSESFASIVERVYSCSDSLPLVLKRILVMLLHPNHMVRPTFVEILTCGTSIESERSRIHVADMIDKNINYKQNKLEMCRCDILVRYCSTTFPSYYPDVYSLSSQIKLQDSTRNTLRVLLSNPILLKTIPLEGISLLMPQIMNVIENYSKFCEDLVQNESPSLPSSPSHDSPFYSSSTDSSEDFNVHTAAHCLPLSSARANSSNRLLVEHYVILVDYISSRLGVESTEPILVPKILCFFRQLEIPEIIIYFLESNLWAILIFRIGVTSFLKNFLPLLLNYLLCGNFQSISIDALDGNSSEETIPCWTDSGLDAWMCKLQRSELRPIQKAANRTIVRLSSADSLGPGLCTRYVLPSLLCVVGVPQLVASAVNVEIDGSKSKAPPSFDAQDMFAVRALIELCNIIGIDACADIILTKIFKEVIPRLSKSLTYSFSASMSASFMEIFFLLNGILPSLSPEVASFYLQPSEASPVSLASLLVKFPLIIHDEGVTSKKKKVDEYSRRHLVLVELCRLIITTSMVVGPETTFECVLPHIDAFFENFVRTYSVLPSQREDFHKALELAAELFVPLVQLVGAEAFYTAVPNLNPRLEMWLLNKSAGEPCTSPPLPPSILPSVASEVDVAPPKKGIMNYISSQWKAFNKSGGGKEKKEKGLLGYTEKENNSGIPMGEMGAFKGIVSLSPSSPPIHDNEDNDDDEFEIEESSIRERTISLDFLAEVSPIAPSPQSPDRSEDAFRRRKDSLEGEIDTTKKDGEKHGELDRNRGSDDISVGNGDDRGVDGESTFLPPSSFLSRMLKSEVARYPVKAEKRPSLNSSSMMSVISKATKEIQRSKEEMSDDELAKLDKKNMDAVWLLAGCSTLNISAAPYRPQTAHVSLTSPSVFVDIGAEVGHKFQLGMRNLYSFRDTAATTSVRTLLVNDTESLLLSSSKTGVNIWGLNSHPLMNFGTYNRHSFSPYRLNFMRCGSQVASCDGNINLWDIESRSTIGYAAAPKGRGPFVHMDIISPRVGIYPGLTAQGDNQVLACTGADVFHMDFRMNTSRPLYLLSEWPLPLSSNFESLGEDRSLSERLADLTSPGSSTSVQRVPGQITCSTSIDYYTIFGSNSGCLWVVDRRIGRSVSSCLAHDCAILQVYIIGDTKLISVSEKSTIVWTFESSTLLKSYEIRGSMEGLTSNSTILGAYDESYRRLDRRLSYVGATTKSSLDYALYTFCGHKVLSTPVPTIGCSDERRYFKDGDVIKCQPTAHGEEPSELKYSSQYIFDDKGNKLSKSKLSITSGVMLPLRRLLLIGTEDGLIRAVV